MTPEEMAALEQYIQLMQRSQGDPLALSANAFGQGPGFLGLEDRPDSWSRLGDKNQIYRDMFQMTGTDMSEYVPGLYDYVAQPKPGDLEGYQSDTTSLYQSNPVYQEIERQVRENNVDLDTAVNAVRTAYENDPEALAGSLPMGNPEFGVSEPDWEAVNRNAAAFLTERNKEVGGQSEADMLRAQYEDYVAPRSAYDKSAESQDLSWSANRDDVMRMMGYDPRESEASVKFQEYNPGTVQATAPRVPMNLENVEGGGQIVPGMQLSDVARGYTPDMPEIQLTADKFTSLTRNPLAGAKRQQRRDQARADAEAVRNSPNRPMVGYIQGRGENLGAGRGVVQRSQKESNALSSWDAAARIAKSKQVGSKKEENLAKLTAFYNTLMYGQ